MTNTGDDADLIHVVLADANVLSSQVLRDYLLYAADHEIITITWSPEILAEVTEHLKQNLAGCGGSCEQSPGGAGPLVHHLEYGLGLVEDAAQVSSGIGNHNWVDETLGGVGGALDVLGMVIDPISSLVAWGVSWLMEHVKPLKDALDWLALTCSTASTRSSRRASR